jgi:hypothetical protein
MVSEIRTSILTGKERDRLLIESYNKLKNKKTDDVLYWSQLAGHNSDGDDYSIIEYEAGI